MSVAPSRRTLRARRRLGQLLDRRGGAEPGRSAVHAMGLVFPGVVGLAAGFDLRGRLRRRARALGLAAIEAGTLQAGAPALRRLARGAASVPCGISLGKRPGTPWAAAGAELARVLDGCHRLADYVVLNPGRERPSPQVFARVVAELAAHRAVLARRTGRRLALVAKLPPAWLRGVQGIGPAQRMAAAGADALLVSAEGMGEPEARAVLRRLDAALGHRVCLISVGGIDSPATARGRLRAGARLLQVHRIMAARGPAVVTRLARGSRPWRGARGQALPVRFGSSRAARMT